ncbi:unnamed protein product [Symbiodinium natans]|nr:unnamed protein product [Symbiodinium natans]
MEEGRLPAQVDRDEVTELESVGWMLYSRECLRQHRRGRNQELRREVRQAQRPVADVEDPTAFEDGPPSEAEGDRPFGDDDGWETFSASALRSASLPDWAMAEEDAGASASNTSESYSAGSGA